MERHKMIKLLGGQEENITMTPLDKEFSKPLGIKEKTMNWTSFNRFHLIKHPIRIKRQAIQWDQIFIIHMSNT